MQSSCPTRVKLRWPLWLLLVVGLVLICLLGFPHPLPRVTILPLVEPKPTLLQATIEHAWWWLQVHVPQLGRSVLVRAKILGFKAHPDLAHGPLAKAPVDANNVQIWLLDQQELDAVSRWLVQSPDFEMVSEPGIQSASGTRGTMTAGNNVTIDGQSRFVGLELTSLPRARNGRVDLVSGITYTEPVTNEAQVVSIRTNIAVRARIQLPKPGGALLISRDTLGGATAVILTGKVL
jgi:hypothetical protein